MGLTGSSLHHGSGREGGGGGGGGGREDFGVDAGDVGGGGGGGGLMVTSGDVIRRCNCYSMSLDRKCYRHSLTFNASHSGGGGSNGGSGHHSRALASSSSSGNSPTANDKSGQPHSRSKKKRHYGFATFKKKLIGKRRHCKGSDHGRCFREHFADCSSPLLKSLLSQYESLTLLKDLSVQANLARPPAQTLGQSLSELFASASCADVVLRYGRHRFPAHKHILMARCPYFSRNLSPDAAEFEIRATQQQTHSSPVSPAAIRCILMYLYTGKPELLREAEVAAAAASEGAATSDVFSPLENFLDENFSIPNRLEYDVAFLGETGGSWADCKLVFNSSGEQQASPPAARESSSSSSGSTGFELMCHKSILAARSGFFRRLLEKRDKLRAATKANESSSSSEIPPLPPSTPPPEIEVIHLDNDIIPLKYGRVLLQAMYMDTLDMRLVTSQSSYSSYFSGGGSSYELTGGSIYGQGGDELQLPCPRPAASQSSQQHQQQLSEEEIGDVMNLYEIGRFLEFNFLSQCCEDLLMQVLTVSNIVDILKWSLEPQGSSWIARQAYQFLEEEFYSFSSNTEMLGRLDQDSLVHILKSDFTQASESELLQALIKWGEQQLKMKSRGFGYLGAASASCSFSSSGNRSSHSHLHHRNSSSSKLLLTRYQRGGGGSSSGNATSSGNAGSGGNAGGGAAGGASSGFCDSQLKELLSPLFRYVRMPHVLPRERASDVIDAAIQRNLFSCHPNFASQGTAASKFAPWDPSSNLNNAYVRPRLFLPYFEECKNIIQDRCAQDPEIIASSSPRLATSMMASSSGSLSASSGSGGGATLSHGGAAGGAVAPPPDTLYMLAGSGGSPSRFGEEIGSASMAADQQQLQLLSSSSSSSAAAAAAAALVEFDSSKLPDNEVLVKMLERSEKLLNFVSVQLCALSLPFSHPGGVGGGGRRLSSSVTAEIHNEILALIELRVVREANLPDNYTNLLRKMRERHRMTQQAMTSSMGHQADGPEGFVAAATSGSGCSSSSFYHPNTNFQGDRMYFDDGSYSRHHSMGAGCGSNIPDVTLLANSCLSTGPMGGQHQQQQAGATAAAPSSAPFRRHHHHDQEPSSSPDLVAPAAAALSGRVGGGVGGGGVGGGRAAQRVSLIDGLVSSTKLQLMTSLSPAAAAPSSSSTSSSVFSGSWKRNFYTSPHSTPAAAAAAAAAAASPFQQQQQLSAAAATADLVINQGDFSSGGATRRGSQMAEAAATQGSGRQPSRFSRSFAGQGHHPHPGGGDGGAANGGSGGGHLQI